MAKGPASASKVYLDQYDFSGYLNGFDFGVKQKGVNVTCLSDAGPRRLVDNYDHHASDLGFFDGASGANDGLIHALLGDANDHYLTHLPGQSAEGGVAYDQLVRLAGKPLQTKVADAVLLNFETEGSGGLSRGLTLANAAVVATGNRTGRNQGAKASPVPYRVMFRLLTFVGTNITLKIQDSTDDAGTDPYADVASLTSGALTAAGIVVVTVTGAIKAYRRVNISGTFTSAVILVTGGNIS